MELVSAVFTATCDLGQLYQRAVERYCWTIGGNRGSQQTVCVEASKKMLSLFILLFSGFALIRFAVSQWRAIWISSANQPLSESLQLTAGIDGATIGAGDFGRLLTLCDQLSPELKKSSPWLSEVSTYYRAIARVQQFSSSKLPSLAQWASREMETCARYVAVVLDQNLAMNMDRRFAAQAN